MICTSIASVSFEEAKALLSKCEMAELRWDLLDFTEEQIEELCEAGTPLIITYRPGENITENERLQKLKKAVGFGPKYVDVEIECLPDFKKEIVRAAKGNCEVIISYHNYKECPKRYELESIVQSCFDQGAQVAKVACQINSHKEAGRLMGLYAIYGNLVALGMGNMGKITRVAATELGSPFTFAALDAKNNTAPGQLTADELKSIYDTLGSK